METQSFNPDDIGAENQIVNSEKKLEKKTGWQYVADRFAKALALSVALLGSGSEMARASETVAHPDSNEVGIEQIEHQAEIHAQHIIEQIRIRGKKFISHTSYGKTPVRIFTAEHGEEVTVAFADSAETQPEWITVDNADGQHSYVSGAKGELNRIIFNDMIGADRKQLSPGLKKAINYRSAFSPMNVLAAEAKMGSSITDIEYREALMVFEFVRNPSKSGKKNVSMNRVEFQSGLTGAVPDSEAARYIRQGTTAYEHTLGAIDSELSK